MKYIIAVGDGIADYPLEELNNQTPLMYAKTPTLDYLAKKGQCGQFQTIAQGMPNGSAVANLTVLGYDPQKTFHGRGVLEAASLGIELTENDLAMRVNLISIQNNKLISHSAGHITDNEAKILVRDLNTFFSDKDIKIYQGLGYRHVMVIPGGKPDIICNPPHDHTGEDINSLIVKFKSDSAKETAELLNEIIFKSNEYLIKHEINKKRVSDGKQPANMLWPWSPGTKPQMTTLTKKFGITGAAVSAVDLIKGIARYAGLDVIPVKGATGLHNTNYEGKASACIEALKTHDFVFLHVEAADEASHEKNINLKIKCIEDFDKRLLRIIMDSISSNNDDITLSVLPDHPTPVSLGIHTRDPVPVVIFSPKLAPDKVEFYNENDTKQGCLGLMQGDEFIRKFFSIN